MIRDNILRIKERILDICKNVETNPGSITIVAVSKNQTVEQIREVIEAGIRDIGENRVQEALSKYRLLKGTPYIRWHMVGHLQLNKVKAAVEIFDLIHSLDSLRLAEKINKYAERINKIQDVLVEVKTSFESTKFGVAPEKVIDFIKELLVFKNLRIKGLMTIAPFFEDPQNTRPFFRILRQLKDEINQKKDIPNIEILSMGMSNDFEIAIQEGANMLRIGRLIFEG